MACVKVYLCSNPEENGCEKWYGGEGLPNNLDQESVVERRLLRQRVVPRLREYCRCTHGVEFRVIDPYEAVEPRNWPSQKERLEILEDCRKNSLGPFFVGLVGEQYGDPCLPEQIEASEFQHVFKVCQLMGLKTDILEKCYQRDENALPPSFCMLNPAGRFKHPGVQPNENNNWFEVLPEVRKILHDVVTQCLQVGIMTHEKAQKYFRSALENDIRYAYEDSSSEDVARCLCYVHKINNPKKKIGLSPEKQAQLHQLTQLREHFLPSMVAFHKALMYSTTTKCNRLQGYTPEMRLDFAVGLIEQLHTDLKRLIDSAVSNGRAVTVDEFGQKDLCRIFSSLYRIEREEVEQVKSYLKRKNTKFPFILNGRPCSGKTVLLAYCASQASMWLKNLDPEIVVYFIDVNNSLRQLLKDICKSVDSSSTCVNNIFQLKENFKRLLTTRSSSKSPLVLIIDGLDQLPKTDGQLDLTLLPETLAPNVKLLISINVNRPELLATLKKYYTDSTVFCELQEVESKSCSHLLTTLLQESNRKITSGQQMYVNQAFKKCSVPLYAELLHRQAVHWKSEFEITEDSLVQEVHNNIVLMFDHLEKKHGKAVVSKALSYLTLARYGMTAAELTDVLSCDDEVLTFFLPPGVSVPLTVKVPEIFVESLLSDLKGFLVLRNILGTQTLFWVSRHFPLVVCKRYLSSEETSQKIHHVLLDYFSGSWANGTAKPLIINEDDSDGPQNINIDIDRQVPSQPWIFSPPFCISTAKSPSARTHPNLRKLHILPFLLLKSGRIEELGNLMFSQEYLQAMLQAKLADKLFLWLEKTSQLVFPKKLQLLHIILRSSACLLRNSPADLPIVLQAKLIPFLNVFPALEECANLPRFDGIILKSGVYTVLPPVPAVPCTHCTPQESTAARIMQSAGSICGTVVVVLENGAAWACNGGIFEGLRLNQLSNLHFTSVSSYGNIFLLSTHCGKLVLWDAHSAQPQEIQTQQRDKTILEGVLVSNDKLFVWWRGQNIVNVFVDREEQTELHCTYEITCVTCSEEGDIIYCGQKEGSVTIFEWSNGQLLATFTCPKDMPLIDMILSEGNGMITCVDQAGNVFAWNLDIITDPILVCENYCTTQEKVLNTDYKRNEVLLLCKKQQMQLIDIDQIDVIDQFDPPRGKTFKQAIMDENSRFILALLCNCPFLLVWNCASGQCVLSLDTANCQAIKLLKCGTSYLAATTSISVLIWDMDLITASALAPKSGKRVDMVAVGLQGESCYSSDGSKLIWKWGVSSGRVEGRFFHQGTVESMSVSGDGNYLVSIAAGDIYVWETRSGENIYRISNSQAYKVLITPKGNSGVALSETGPSRVWKLQNGHRICSIHLHLRNATISPESTFLLGLHSGDLLAVSLWSGNVSKCFSCSDLSDVVAFHSLLDHPDYVIVSSASGNVYSWRLTEDTICHQFQLPDSSLCQPEIFRLSTNGEYAILSISESTINILDFSNSKLCSLRTEGPVLKQYASVGVFGQYVVYICFSSLVCQNISCDFHEKPMLVAIRLTDGETIGRFYFCKNPSTLMVSEDSLVYVGFQDGSVGVYGVNDTKTGKSSRIEDVQSPTLLCPLDEQLIWSPRKKPNLTWVELPLQMY
ncbi:NACHT and WD repeat domain-containing protein 2 isoform X2 [Puntigrus tetrazona]|uniref:NACHT and WD repeat domain-containing protein 2 isoform X2 n=1 Tax=Puntigrus tetrazona TaxID=1606681 RepID=UPI001C8A7930|nr:NACHT and WD repeat domain-containing protein 2 isoform X2 [Puntigrus tetrazona]